MAWLHVAASAVRTHALVTQYGRDNENSYLYGYDDLRRLTSADMGAIDPNSMSFLEGQSYPIPLRTTWNLDNLGNWSGGDPNAAGGMVQTGDFDFDGTADPNRFFHHAIDSENAIGAITTDLGAGATTQKIITDVAGNLTFDGTYWYQHDGWNRLIEIRLAGALDPNDFNPDGSLAAGVLDPNDPNAPAPGDIVAAYIYDGLGRLVRRESPVASYQNPRVETYLYEGVRRIQERVDSPDGNDSEREYVYGRDYVDEVLFQFDEAGDAFYVLQDANYNVVALLDTLGAIVEQYTYSPYGEIIAGDILDPNAAPLTRLGFQGLFFDRLDVSPDNQRLDPNSFGHYRARNRWYRSDLGRFTTKDVNATALPIMAALTVNAESFNILLRNFSGSELYGGGCFPGLFLASLRPAAGC